VARWFAPKRSRVVLHLLGMLDEHPSRSVDALLRLTSKWPYGFRRDDVLEQLAWAQHAGLVEPVVEFQEDRYKLTARGKCALHKLERLVYGGGDVWF
jgi:hypothetical protein